MSAKKDSAFEDAGRADDPDITETEPGHYPDGQEIFERLTAECGSETLERVFLAAFLAFEHPDRQYVWEQFAALRDQLGEYLLRANRCSMGR